MARSRETKRLALRAEFRAILNENDAIEQLLKRCAQLLVQYLPEACIGIWTLSTEEGLLRLQAVAGQCGDFPEAYHTVSERESLPGKIAASRQAYMTNEIVADLHSGDRAWAEEQGMVSFAGYPLLSQDELFGVLAVFARKPLEAANLEALAFVAQAIAQSIKRKWAEQALQEKEAQYRSIFEASSDGLAISTMEGILVEANPAFCHMHGYTYEEVIGQHITAFMHPEYQHLADIYVETVKQGKDFQTRSLNVRKDGTSFPVEVHRSAFSYQGTLHMLGILRDISERVQAYQLLEQRVEERTRELSTLLEVSRTVVSTLELKPLLALILDQLRTVVDYEDVAVVSLQGHQVSILDYRGPLGSDTLTRFHTLLVERSGESVALRLDQPLIIDDAHDNVAQLNMRAALNLSSSSARSWLTVPLIVKERLVGLLTLVSDVPGYYSGQSVKLVQAFAAQAAVALENARLYKEAQELAALKERQHLARELHDSVSQALFGITLGAQTALETLPGEPDQALDPIKYVLSLANAGLAEMRALIFELRPESLETEGLTGALAKQIAVLRTRYKLTVDAQLGEEPDLSLERKEGLYRIAQEALHNIVKHAQATHILIRLNTRDDEVTLLIHDNGKGFDPTASFPGHLGLKSMQERTTRSGGTLSIESVPGHGTTLRVHLPMREEAEPY